MSNSKINPRYNLVSSRISDEEKAVLDEVSQRTRKTLSTIVREAIQLYSRDVTLFSSDSKYPA